MTIDPVTTTEAAAAAWAGLRFCHAVADYLVLCGRARLARAAAALPAGTHLTGAGWEIRLPGPKGQR